MSIDLIKAFHIKDASPPEYFQSIEDITSHARSQPYSHVMRRAWQSLKLDGIYCIENRPTVYFKRSDTLSPTDIRRLHRQFWNHGVAPLLVLVSETHVNILSSLMFPSRDDDIKFSALVETLNTVNDALRVKEFLKSVHSGGYYKEQRQAFNPKCCIDQYLLQNLRDARDQLVEGESGLGYEHAHSLLGKVIFTSYLTERCIIGSKVFADVGSQGCTDLRSLFEEYSPSMTIKLFKRLLQALQTYFNGNVFDNHTSCELTELTAAHLDTIRRFLNGDRLSTRQISLGFWVYDFSIIPIETISAIYEDFLSAESQYKQHTTGTYYTPKHLAEFVLDVGLSKFDTLLDKKFMDPACGSGVFLVILFNRIAEEWRASNPGVSNSHRADALLMILQTQLCGVDVHETACRITCFSLYLALLDQLEPRDVKLLKEERGWVLPQLLNNGSPNRLTANGATVRCANFFDIESTVCSGFDLVVGNPPWVSRQGRIDESAANWVRGKDNQYWKCIADKYDAPESVFVPQGQIAHAFMWKAAQHTSRDGIVCLLLPTSVLLKRTDKFQSAWFYHFKVDRIIQLSDLRRLLFENAITPSLIMSYSRAKEGDRASSVRFIVPKASPIDPRRGVIEILPQDNRQIPMSAITEAFRNHEAPLVWKKHCWASPRDLKLLDRLQSFPRLSDVAGRPRQGRRWVSGQGFQPFHADKYLKNPGRYGEPKQAWWSSEHLYLDANTSKFDLILKARECESVGNRFRKLRRKGEPRVYDAPVVLVNKGCTRAALSLFPVLFQDFIYGIAGPTEDVELLALLTGILKSQLARYFLFHTSTSWGIERNQIQPNEYLNLPFPLPEQLSNTSRSRNIASSIAHYIIDAEQLDNANYFTKGEITKGVMEKIDDLVCEYFELGDIERNLIHDTTHFIIPSITPSSIHANVPLWRDSTKRERIAYVKVLCGVLNKWSDRSGYRVSGKTIVSPNSDVAVVMLNKEDAVNSVQEVQDNENLLSILSSINSYLLKENVRFSLRRTIIVFDGEQLFVSKPLGLRHWTVSAAYNDADDLALSILSGETVTDDSIR